MTTIDKGADQGVACPVSAKRPARRPLTIAVLVLAAALVFQPRESRAFNIGPIMNMLTSHYGKSHQYHSKKSPRHIARKGHPDKEHANKERPAKEKPPAKEPEGPIFSAAR